MCPAHLRYDHLPRLITLLPDDSEGLAGVVDMILARAELANDTFDELLLAARNTLLAAIRWSEGISELMMQLSDVPSSQRRI